MSNKSRYRFRDLHWNTPSRVSTRTVTRAVGELSRAISKSEAERQRRENVERIQKLMRPTETELRLREKYLREMGF